MEKRRRLYTTVLAILLLAMVCVGAASADPVTTERRSDAQAWAPWSALIKTIDSVLERLGATWGAPQPTLRKHAPNLDPDGLSWSASPGAGLDKHAPVIDPHGLQSEALPVLDKHAPNLDPNGLTAAPLALDHHAPMIDPNS